MELAEVALIPLSEASPIDVVVYTQAASPLKPTQGSFS